MCTTYPCRTELRTAASPSPKPERAARALLLHVVVFKRKNGIDHTASPAAGTPPGTERPAGPSSRTPNCGHRFVLGDRRRGARGHFPQCARPVSPDYVRWARSIAGDFLARGGWTEVRASFGGCMHYSRTRALLTPPPAVLHRARLPSLLPTPSVPQYKPF
jgi:hypothetical protein